MDDALLPRLRERIDGLAVLGDVEGVGRHLGHDPTPGELGLALLGAAGGGHLTLCQRLLEVGAPLGPAGERGMTPLQRAVAKGHHDVTEFLLDRGADIAATNVFGSTALHTAGIVGADEPMIALLARAGATEIIDERNQFDMTALDWAIEHGHEKTANELRTLGATSSPDETSG